MLATEEIDTKIYSEDGCPECKRSRNHDPKCPVMKERLKKHSIKLGDVIQGRNYVTKERLEKHSIKQVPLVKLEPCPECGTMSPSPHKAHCSIGEAFIS